MRMIAIVVGLVLISSAQVTEAWSEGHPDHTYDLRYVAPFERELVFRTGALDADSEGEELGRFRLKGCGLGSSETGAFPLLSEVHADPVVGVVCETLGSRRSLYVFAPASNGVTPVFAVEEKLSLTVMVAQAGMVVGWAEPGTPDRYHNEFWEPDRGLVNTERFREARDAAVGKRIERAGFLPDGLVPGDYVMALDPDTPMRLGPSMDAPWFKRLGDWLLIHLDQGDAAETAPAFWTIGDGWLRVCIVDGGCGYALATELVRLQ